jgi:hypothetical protein
VAPGEGALRLTRAAGFALSAVGLASAAHLADGNEVPLFAALLSVPLVMVVVHLLAGRRASPFGLFLGMGLTQVALHLAFMAASLTPTCVPTGSMAGMPMHAEHGHGAVHCETVLAHATAGRLLPPVSMLLAHLLATALVVLLLARGEAALWALASCLRFRFRLPRVSVLLPAFRRLPVVVGAWRRVPQTVPRRSVRRRGPPRIAHVAV